MATKKKEEVVKEAPKPKPEPLLDPEWIAICRLSVEESDGAQVKVELQQEKYSKEIKVVRVD